MFGVLSTAAMIPGDTGNHGFGADVGPRAFSGEMIYRNLDQINLFDVGKEKIERRLFPLGEIP